MYTIFISCNEEHVTNKQADITIHNAKFTPLDKGTQEAEAIVISGKHILAVGHAKEVLKHKGKNTKVIDVKGRRIIPEDKLDLATIKKFEAQLLEKMRKAKTMSGLKIEAKNNNQS